MVAQQHFPVCCHNTVMRLQERSNVDDTGHSDLKELNLNPKQTKKKLRQTNCSLYLYYFRSILRAEGFGYFSRSFCKIKNLDVS